MKTFLVGLVRRTGGRDTSDNEIRADHGGAAKAAMATKSRRWRHGERNEMRTAANGAVFGMRRKG